MKTRAEMSLTTPNKPLRKSEEDTDVKPADMKMTGASVCHIVRSHVIKLARGKEKHTV